MPNTNFKFGQRGQWEWINGKWCIRGGSQTAIRNQMQSPYSHNYYTQTSHHRSISDSKRDGAIISNWCKGQWIIYSIHTNGFSNDKKMVFQLTNVHISRIPYYYVNNYKNRMQWNPKYIYTYIQYIFTQQVTMNVNNFLYIYLHSRLLLSVSLFLSLWYRKKSRSHSHKTKNTFHFHL